MDVARTKNVMIISASFLECHDIFVWTVLYRELAFCFHMEFVKRKEQDG